LFKFQPAILNIVCAEIFSTLSRKLFRPASCAMAMVTNCDHRDAVREERPEWCRLERLSNSCLGIYSSNCENTVLSMGQGLNLLLLQCLVALTL